MYLFLETAVHRGSLNSRRSASPFVRLVEREWRWEAYDHPNGILPKNWGGTEKSNQPQALTTSLPSLRERHDNNNISRGYKK
ncbi:hypothetical protein TNCV_2328981 [Trichonephila clavipes]|nr:hypothetical protein TNCV_2328981 [Trichonephila clavipes]